MAVKNNKRMTGTRKAAAHRRPAKKKPAETRVYTCKTCGKTTKTRSHLCNPQKASNEVYVCEFCGITSGDPRHVCSPMIAEVKYHCKNCGRVSPFRGALCQPKALK